jgi:hypothetical protein
MSSSLVRQVIFLTAAFALLAPATHAGPQQRGPRAAPPIPGGRPAAPTFPTVQPGARHGRQRPGAIGSPEAELLKRAEIRHEEENHREMVERADETVRLGVGLRDNFAKTRGLGRDDLKLLERMEKLARKIRGGAGGSDDDERLEDPPAQIEQAVARIAEVSEKLGESVRKSSRLVVSGAVIKGSNELIELIRHTRAFVKP